MLRLTPAQMIRLRECVNIVARGAATYGTHDARYLAELDVLEEILEVDLALCTHCHAAPRRSRDGLCARCNDYRRKDAARRDVPQRDGHLPPAELLRQRVLRAARRAGPLLAATG